MGRGKLKFKGEEKAKKKKKSSSKKQLGSGGVGAINGGGDDAINIATSSAGTESSTTHQQSVAAAATNSAHQTNSNESAASSTSLQKSPQISQGQGTITTSSTVVTGHGTSFKTQLHVGDALLAQTSKGDEEMRVIKMVLSNISISISSAFSTDLKTPTQFKYINKPRDVTRESQAKVAKARMEQEEVEQRAMGTYGNKGEIIYRERTEHGSYRIKREQAATDMTRSDLLSVRAKKKSDRYC